jgi:hypothetical protein
VAFPSMDSISMHPMTGSIAALAVASIYYVWKTYFQLQRKRERALCERVTYMLWVMANHAE